MLFYVYYKLRLYNIPLESKRYIIARRQIHIRIAYEENGLFRYWERYFLLEAYETFRNLGAKLILGDLYLNSFNVNLDHRITI